MTEKLSPSSAKAPSYPQPLYWLRCCLRGGQHEQMAFRSAAFDWMVAGEL